MGFVQGNYLSHLLLISGPFPAPTVVLVARLLVPTIFGVLSMAELGVDGQRGVAFASASGRRQRRCHDDIDGIANVWPRRRRRRNLLLWMRKRNRV